METGLAVLILAVVRLAVPLAVILTIGILVERHNKAAHWHG
jgi:hypothetical protein